MTKKTTKLFVVSFILIMCGMLIFGTGIMLTDLDPEIVTGENFVPDQVELYLPVLSKRGSTGNEVTKIQKKLKTWGYYSGSVDGIYGSRTEKAVRLFQQRNGLTVDGIAGPVTLKAMGIFSSSSSSGSSSTSTSANLDLLARVVYGEARGEPYMGQVAVAAVILNRVKDSRFPKTVAGVVYQAGAFDVVADGQINLTPDQTAYNAARDALNGWDPTYGCLYYYNPATATNKWIKSLPISVRIGRHVFCHAT